MGSPTLIRHAINDLSQAYNKALRQQEVDAETLCLAAKEKIDKAIQEMRKDKVDREESDA